MDGFAAFSQSLMLARIRLAAILFVPTFGILTLLRDQYSASAAYQIQAGIIPFILATWVAACMPHGLPPTGTGYVVAVFAGLIALDAQKVLAVWHSPEPALEELARAAVAAIWMAGNAWLVQYLWRWRLAKASFWIGLRINLCVGNGARLAVVLLLRAVHPEPRAMLYLPGHLDFVSAVLFNVGCLAFAVVGLSPRCRKLLSERAQTAYLDLAVLPSGLQSEDKERPADAQSASEEQEQEQEPVPAADVPSSLPLDLNQAWCLPLIDFEISLMARSKRCATSSSDKAGAQSVISDASSAQAELMDAWMHADGGEDDDYSQQALYSMHPQFMREDVPYLTPIQRREHVPNVDRLGRLVYRDGTVLAPNGPVEGMYVLDAHGTLLVALAETSTLHHSSLVAGEAVLAAGQLTVLQGYVVELSNESGHYTPSPSSLQVVMRRLTQQGAARLDRVALNTVYRESYDISHAEAPHY